MKETILLTGGSGFIGRILVKRILSLGYSVIVTGRTIEKLREIYPKDVTLVAWDGRSIIVDLNSYGTIDYVIHLAGAGVADKRWNSEYKNEILTSRTISTAKLLASIALLDKKPKAFICSSATGFYGDTGEGEITESRPKGTGFLSDVCASWEAEAQKAEELGIRWVSIRSGIVLDTQGGALPKMMMPYKFFVGGVLGNGRQWFSWIHIDDIIGIYVFAIQNSALRGVFNATTSSPVRMVYLANLLGVLLHRPVLFQVPEFVLKIVLGESAIEITKSQKVIPERLLQAGYKFQFHSLESAIKDLLIKK